MDQLPTRLKAFEQDTHTVERPLRWRRGLAYALLMVAVGCAIHRPAEAAAGDRPAIRPASATAAAASVPVLNWQPCAAPSQQGFDCATAQVPLDYGDPQGATIDLAVIRHPADEPAQSFGALFFNPGGPSSAGTTLLPAWLQYFPATLRARFDLISWDPRGVGQSTAVRCFDSAEEAIAWLERVPEGFPVGRRERANWIAAYAELGQRCQERAPDLLRHVSTTDTARDLDQLRQAVGEEQLTYLGVSYGTFLGATYANLFPDRVRAMVFDGNMDPQAYINTGAPGGPRLNTGLRLGSDLSSAATLDQFLSHCGRATIDRCAFSAGSPEATREKFDALLRRLQDDPQGVWTYGKTVNTVELSLYIVHPWWTTLAETLQDLWEERTPEPPDSTLPNPRFAEEYAVVCPESPNPRNPRRYRGMEAFSAARAGDVGRWWTWDYEPCATWPATAAERYVGPWDRPTASPVLVINNAYDPGTSHAGAQAMVRELADAYLLTVAGYGHTVLINPSTCAMDYVSRYIVDGTLPPEGIVCPPDQQPFTTGP